MIEHKTIIVVADWRRALIAIKRDILDAEPVVALKRIDRLLDQIPWCNDGAHMGTKGRKLHQIKEG